jgi:hypothetical protein
MIYRPIVYTDSKLSLDSMGLATFSHDFGALNGEHSGVADAFEALGNQPFSWVALLGFLLSTVVPALTFLPTTRNKTLGRLRDSCKGLARKIIADASAAEARGDKPDEKSIIGLLRTCSTAYLPISVTLITRLVKSQSAETGFPMTEEEVSAQVSCLLISCF